MLALASCEGMNLTKTGSSNNGSVDTNTNIDTSTATTIDTTNTTTTSEAIEITYNEFKRAYYNKEDISFNQCIFSEFNGYIDSLEYRLDDGSPIFKETTLNYNILTNEWLDDNHYNGYRINRGVSWMMTDQAIEKYGTKPSYITSLKFYKQGSNYIMEMKGKDNSYFLNSNNRVEYNATEITVFNKYFYVTSVKMLIDDELDCRAHDNKVLGEGRFRWFIVDDNIAVDPTTDIPTTAIPPGVTDDVTDVPDNTTTTDKPFDTHYDTVVSEDTTWSNTITSDDNTSNTTDSEPNIPPQDDNEISFDEFKAAFEARDIKTYYHCESEEFVGYIDSLIDRLDGDTQICKLSSLDYKYNEDAKKYKWTDEYGRTYTLLNQGMPSHLTDEDIASYGSNQPEYITSIKFYKIDNYYIVESKGIENRTHIHDPKNYTDYHVTARMVLNEYFYVTYYSKTVDELLDCRLHDNRVLMECRYTWSTNGTEPKEIELTYEEFKALFDARDKVSYDHLEYEYFAGFIDTIEYRDSDGTPILEHLSLDYTFDKRDGEYKWTTEDGSISYTFNGPGILTEDALDFFEELSLSNPSARFIKEDNKYIIEFKTKETEGHIYDSNNYTEHTSTFTFVYDKDFYMIEYIKTVDELLDCRAHDNKVLIENHFTWSTINLKPKEIELTYDEFKSLFDERDNASYDHLEYETFYGYIDTLDNRDSDGTPIFTEKSLDYIYNERYGEYKWTTEDDTIYTFNGRGILTEELLDFLNILSSRFTSIRYIKYDNKYIIELKITEPENEEHIYDSKNYIDYDITIKLIYDDYFYMIEYIKTVDELLDCRCHNNKVLIEEHYSWSTNPKPKEIELTYDEFKALFDARDNASYDHVEHESFYGYIDTLDNRDEDGNPILKKVSLDNIYNEENDKYMWTDKDGNTSYNFNVLIISNELLEAFKILQQDSNVWSVKFIQYDSNYIIEIKALNNTNIYNPDNYTNYNITLKITYNKYFYMIDYIKTVDELLDCRCHNNKVLVQEHATWSYNLLKGNTYEIISYNAEGMDESEAEVINNTMLGSRITFKEDMTIEWEEGFGIAYGIYYIENYNYKYIVQGFYVGEQEYNYPDDLKIIFNIYIKEDNYINIQSWYGNYDTLDGFTDFHYINYICKKVVTTE